MSKSSNRSNASMARFNFPHHEQAEPTSCGPACLRMLAEWAGNEHKDEKYWQDHSGWKKTQLLPIVAMQRALKTIREICPTGTKPQFEKPQWRVDGSRPHDVFGRDTVYLLHTDSYNVDGVNIGHWIILLNIFDSKESEHGQQQTRLALCADPSSPEGEVSVWTWQSLLETKVTDALRIVRVPTGGS